MFIRGKAGRHRARTGRAVWARRGIALAALLVMLFWHREPDFAASTVVFVCVGGFLLSILIMASRQQSWSHLPIPPPGRVVAVVPAFNEDPDALRACIQGLLRQTYPLDAIYVVDDGSNRPINVQHYDRVFWVRTWNGGKRFAQAVGLQAEVRRADFIVTVDSDSVLAPDGLAKAMRAFGDNRVQAVTGLPVLRNRTASLITRLTDMEIVYGCLTMRRARSSLGAVCPTSGAFAAYRAAIFFDNIDDYLSSGTYSDDRRLTHYALLRGRVISVDDAIVETDMPTTPRGVFRQRVRWFKGSWKFLPWELRNLRGAPIVFRLWNASMFVLYPIFITNGLIVLPMSGRAVDLTPLLYWLVLLYIQSFYYVLGRRRVPLVKRVVSWVFLTPLVSLFQLTLIRPSMYYALTQLRSDAWATRGQAEQFEPNPTPEFASHLGRRAA